MFELLDLALKGFYGDCSDLSAIDAAVVLVLGRGIQIWQLFLQFINKDLQLLQLFHLSFLGFLHLFSLIPQQGQPRLSFLNSPLSLLQNKIQGCITQQKGSYIQQCSIIIHSIMLFIFLLSHPHIQLLSFSHQTIFQLFDLQDQLDLEGPIQIEVAQRYIFQFFSENAIYLVLLTDFPSQVSILCLKDSYLLPQTRHFRLHFGRTLILPLREFELGRDAHLGKELGVLLPGDFSLDAAVEKVEAAGIFGRDVESGFAEAGSRRRHTAQQKQKSYNEIIKGRQRKEINIKGQRFSGGIIRLGF